PTTPQPTTPQPTQLIKTNVNEKKTVSLVNDKEKIPSKNIEALPQTSEKSESSVSALGVLLLALGSLTSWLTFRKKWKD
ncbi:LPXTG cell wall anchor domain-containing protein, partial [Pediococcus acidilactici]